MSVLNLYPTVRPTLSFDFVNAGVLDPSVTFTRPTSATYFDETGILRVANPNTPRFDYNPSTLAPLGFLIEESRTNSIRNNTMVGAVAGTPGTLPTNWNVANLGTLTSQVVGTGTSNGINYIDFRLSGTTSTTQFSLRLEPNGTAAIPALNGQTWTGSAWLALVGGSTTNISQVGQSGLLWDAGGAFLGGGYAGPLTPSSIATNLTRFTASGTNAIVGTAFIQPQIYLVFASGVTIDITLRIGLPQLEQGAFATSVIPTSTTALTRSQDRAVVNTLAPWFNSVAGTIYAEFSLTLPVSGGNQFLARFSDNSYNNSIVDNVALGGGAQLATASGGVFDGTASAAGVITANTTTKFAGAYATNDLAASRDGGAVATDNTAIIPSGLTRFDLGSDHVGANNVKAGYLRRITYYPVRLSNAQLQNLTA
jgi:hypothetical protein